MLLPRDLLSQLCAESLYWCPIAKRFVNRIHQKHVLSGSLNTWLEELDSRENVYAYRPNAHYPTVICRWNERESVTIKKNIAPHSICYMVEFLFDYNRTTVQWSLLEMNGVWTTYSEERM